MENTPKHFVTLCVSRELTDIEFEELTDIVDDEIGDIIMSDDVHEYPNESNMICYMFEIWTPIDNCEQGPAAYDLMSYEIDQILPAKLTWYLVVN